MTTTEAVKPLTERTPAEIDTELYGLMAERYTAHATAETYRGHVKRAYADLVTTGTQGRTVAYTVKRGRRTERVYRSFLGTRYEVDDTVKRVESLKVTVAEAEAEVARITEAVNTLEDEFDRRGGWHRYFWVTGNNGHIHREMTCSTCYPTTQFVWLTHLSDCDEREMVAQYGERACTVCFPDAPTLPEWQQAIDAAKAADPTCEHSGQAVPDECMAERYRNYGWVNSYRMPHVRCECGWSGAMTKSGKYRKHNKEGVK